MIKVQLSKSILLHTQGEYLQQIHILVLLSVTITFFRVVVVTTRNLGLNCVCHVHPVNTNITTATKHVHYATWEITPVMTHHLYVISVQIIQHLFTELLP
jgi:hypothetical protein